jgi:hypothetical protein
MPIFGLPISANLNATPADPSITTSSTGVMMGLGSSATIRPTATGKINIQISGDIDNSSGGASALVQIRYGTGTAPANGAALTGTTLGARPVYTQSNATGLLGLTFSPGRGNFSLSGVVSGLLIGTIYWIDISLATAGSGTARIRNVTITANESTS